MEEDIIIDINYNTSGAQKNIDNLTDDIFELSQANKELRDEQKKNKGTTEQEIKNRKELNRRIETNKDAIKSLRKERNEALRVINKEKSAFQKLGKTLKSTATSYFGVVAAIAAVIKGIGGIIKSSAEFQKSLSSLQAITGANTQDMKFYEQQAKSTSEQTLQSAVEIVKAYELVGSAQPELLKNKEALAAVTKEAIILSEATGGKLGLVDAAKATTGVMNQMGLAADQARRVINTLAAGSKAGAAAIPELTEGYKAFGAVLDAANGTVEDGVALQEVLAEKQIVGAEAGTKLRNILIELQKDQRNYKNGSFNLTLALENLNKENANAVELTDRFGKQNVVAAQILAKNVDAFKNYKNAVTGTNTALEQQAIQNDNLSANWKKFINRIKNLFTNAKFAEFLNGIVKWFLKLVTTINKFRNSFVENFNDLIRESTIFRAVIQGLGSYFKSVFDIMKGAIKNTILGFKTFGLVIKAALKGDFRDIPDIIKEGFNEIKENVVETKDDIVANFKKIKDVIDGDFDGLLLKIKEVNEEIVQTTIDRGETIKKIEAKTYEASMKLAKHKAEEIIGIEKLTQAELTNIAQEYLNESLNLFAANYDERYAIAQRFTNSILELNQKRLKGEEITANDIKEISKGISRDIYNSRKSALDAELMAVKENYSNQIGAFEEGSEIRKILEAKQAKEIYEIQLKQFKLQRAQALLEVAINTAVAVSKVWGQTGLGGLIAQAAPIAMGIAQAALIATKKPPAPPTFAKGGEVKSGIFKGASHAGGGINLRDDSGRVIANVERDERFFVLNKNAKNKIRALSDINEQTGGRAFAKRRVMQEGGEANLQPNIMEALRNLHLRVHVEDIKTGLTDYDNVINAGVL